MLCVALYFVVRYASCSMCMYCNVLIVNQGGGLHASETVLGVAGVTGVCLGVGFLPLVTMLRFSVTWFWFIKTTLNY